MPPTKQKHQFFPSLKPGIQHNTNPIKGSLDNVNNNHNNLSNSSLFLDDTIFSKYAQTDIEFAKLKQAITSAPATDASTAGATPGGVSGGSSAANAAAAAAYAQLDSDYKKLKDQFESEHQETIKNLTKILSLQDALKAKEEEYNSLKAKTESQEAHLRELQTSETSVKDIVTLYCSENKNLRKETESQRDLIRQEKIKNDAITSQFIRQSEEIEARTIKISELKDELTKKDAEIARLIEQQKMLSTQQQQQHNSANSGNSANSSSGGLFGFFKARNNQGDSANSAAGGAGATAGEHRRGGDERGKKSTAVEYDIQIPTAVDRTLEGHSDDVQCIAYSTSGNLIATGGVDKVVRVWSNDVAGQPPMLLKGATKGINKVMFSLEDDLILGCSNDNTARVWKVMNGSVLHTYTGHTDSVTCGSFIPNSQKIVTGGKDRVLKIWDIQKGNCVKTIPAMSSCNDAIYLSGTQCLATAHADKSVRMFDINTQQRVDCFEGIHAGQITGIAAADDGRRLFTLGRDDTVKIVDSLSRNIVSSLSDSNFRTASNQARLCVAPGAGFVCAGSANGRVFIWDLKMFRLRQVLIPESAKTDKMYIYPYIYIFLSFYILPFKLFIFYSFILFLPFNFLKLFTFSLFKNILPFHYLNILFTFSLLNYFIILLFLF